MSCSVSRSNQRPQSFIRQGAEGALESTSQTFPYNANRYVETLHIQLNPRPIVRGGVSTCQHCGQHLIPLGYRIRTSNKTIWHVRCYQEKHDLEQELIDNSAVLSIDETQIDIEALAYVYQWEADLLGVDAQFTGAYISTVLSNNLGAEDLQMTLAGDEGNDLDDVIYVIEAGSEDGEEEEFWESDGNRPFYDGFNQPIADFYLNRPPQPLTNGRCVASANIGPVLETEECASDSIPRFPARLCDLLEALEKNKRTLKDRAVFMVR